MSKFLRTAALVVGGVALAAGVVVTAGALAAGIPLSAGLSLGISTPLFSIAGASVSALTLAAGAAALAVAGSMFAKRPTGSGGGEQTSFKADPNAGLPYPIGRTLVGGNIIYRKVHGPTNRYQSIVAILAATTALSIDAFSFDGVEAAVAGDGEVDIPNHGYAYEIRQRGLTPSPAALTGHWPGMPGWDASSKLSGYAASLVQLQYDTAGDNTLVTTPKCGWLGRWASAYDPRLDSTYPGGSGPHRWHDESTWTWSENPYLHALTWCIGRRFNGRRVLGLGASIDQIIVRDFVEGASVADANGWTIGGQVYSRPDTKWNVLKSMLQAGGGEPMRVGARIGCLVQMPRVSLATVRSGDIVGECSLPATMSRRERINGAVPRYRSEAHKWEIVPAAPIRIDDYVAIDGDERTREFEYPLVQDVDQATQLAAYDVLHTREFGPGTFPMKPAWLNYRAGDCVTFEIPQMPGRKMLFLNRSLDPATCVVTMTARSETDSKHAYALTRTGTPPATASLGSVPYNPLAPVIAGVSGAATSGDLAAANATIAAQATLIADIQTRLDNAEIP